MASARTGPGSAAWRRCARSSGSQTRTTCWPCSRSATPNERSSGTRDANRSRTWFRPRGSARLSSQAKRSVQESEQDESDQTGGEDVPRPRSEEVEQGWARRLGAQVHVVGAGDRVDSRDERRVGDRDEGDPDDRRPAWLQAQADHQDQRRDDHAAVRDVVLEVRVAGEALRKVWREQGLDRPRQTPEVGDLDKQAVPRPQGGGRDEDRDVTELQGQRVGKRAAWLTAAQQIHPPADLVNHENGSEQAEPGSRPGASRANQDRGGGRDHGQGANMLRFQQAGHSQLEPGSSHSGVTPIRRKRERFLANQPYRASSRKATGHTR